MSIGISQLISNASNTKYTVRNYYLQRAVKMCVRVGGWGGAVFVIVSDPQIPPLPCIAFSHIYNDQRYIYIYIYIVNVCNTLKADRTHTLKVYDNLPADRNQTVTVYGNLPANRNQTVTVCNNLPADRNQTVTVNDNLSADRTKLSQSTTICQLIKNKLLQSTTPSKGD